MEFEKVIDIEHGFATVHHLMGGEEIKTAAERVMLVWHDTQILPAEQYRRANFENLVTDIAVCDDPNIYLPMIGGERGIIYHFTSSSPGGVSRT